MCCHTVNLWRRVRKFRHQKIRRASNFPLHNFSSSCINPGTSDYICTFFVWVTVQQIILLPSVWYFNNHLERKYEIKLLNDNNLQILVWPTYFDVTLLSHNILFRHNFISKISKSITKIFSNILKYFSYLSVPICGWSLNPPMAFWGRAEGQLYSEWIYEIIVSPQVPTKNLKDFWPGRE